ncbi:MAG TPA: three-Cys-motif partner protein TcmP [Candidatus Sulfotelmatobacter sp.]|nr:three-Cys-motif partner protein TcmP [Candidatus Sulfotelmatobacter sp.]
MPGPRIDEIGPWSEVKLDILKRYAAEYSKILSNRKNPSFFHVYIDAFAGAGFHLSETSGEMVLGSPLNALLVRPPFREYHLIDLDGDKIDGLNELIGKRRDVFPHKGNCNQILLRDVFPRVLREDFKRGLCLLDPYALTLDWKVIQRAGEMRSLDIFINFPIYDININVLHRDPETVLPQHIERMNAYWGDESWREVAYEKSPGLFGVMEEKVTNRRLAEAFRERLKKVAGFKKVPQPLPMRNSKNSVVYYLFFASHKDTAEHIVTYIFDTFGKR